MHYALAPMAREYKLKISGLDNKGGERGRKREAVRTRNVFIKASHYHKKQWII